MKDVIHVLAAADQLFAARDEGALVTLFHTKGSTYRRPGARMLVLPGCRTVGTISGGCLESAVAREAWALTRTAPRASFVFDSAPEDDTWGPASGCHGRLYLLAERIGPGERHPALEQMAEVRRSMRPAMHAQFFERHTDGSFSPIDPPRDVRWESEQQITLANATSRFVEHENVAAFLEFLAPPPHLLLCGAGDDAQPVARFAAELAWRIDVLDTRARLATAERFPTATRITAADPEKLSELIHPHSAAVLMSHRFADDLEFLAQLLQVDPPLGYIGLLGPRRRTDRMLDELATRNIFPTPRQRLSLRSPIGLDLGATTPETIALSIIAEIQAAGTSRDAHPLSNRVGPIHLQPSATSH